MSNKTDQNKPKTEHIYAGDGVYVEDIGWAFNIRVNDHRNPVAVVIEPIVLQTIVDFARRRGIEIK